MCLYTCNIWKYNIKLFICYIFSSFLNALSYHCHIDVDIPIVNEGSQYFEESKLLEPLWLRLDIFWFSLISFAYRWSSTCIFEELGLETGTWAFYRLDSHPIPEYLWSNYVSCYIAARMTEGFRRLGFSLLLLWREDFSVSTRQHCITGGF